MGIEALSRGASACTFVDDSRAATTAIARNLAKTRLEDRGVVVASDAVRFLEHPPVRREVDLVFVDPPYRHEGPGFDLVFERLAAGWLADTGWTVVVTRGHKASLPGVPLHWATRRQLRYGDSLLILYGP
jgi:16S rRNA (guanine966-N2)-methyltransferase